MNRFDKEIKKKREKVEQVVKKERFKRQELCVLVNDGWLLVKIYKNIIDWYKYVN